jgi:hypothetical protein
MPMNASERCDVLRVTDQVMEHGGDPSRDTVPQELCSGEPTQPWEANGQSGLDEGAYESFVGGAGI